MDNDTHSVRVDRLGSWEIQLQVSRVSDEHAAYVARCLHVLQGLFRLDGSDVEVTVYAERNRDGVERIYELIPGEED